jgi:hypothetical protein
LVQVAIVALRIVALNAWADAGVVINLHG